MFHQIYFLKVLTLIFILGLVSCGGGGGDSSSPATGDNGSSTITPDPLTFMENDFAHKWRRYHSFDGSSQYFVFNTDRTGCYFEVSSSGSQSNQSNYVHWELNEASPLGTNIFQLVTQSSPAAALYYRADEFHYAPNELWKGGYSSLKMYPSTTTRDCQ